MEQHEGIKELERMLIALKKQKTRYETIHKDYAPEGEKSLGRSVILGESRGIGDAIVMIERRIAYIKRNAEKK